MSHLPRIVGIGRTKLGRSSLNATQLALDALDNALKDARLTRDQLSGMVAVPSLSNPQFMQGHYLATQAGLLPKKRMIVRTIDTGGAGPISGLQAACSILEYKWADAVAIVASDAVLSLDNTEFLKRADEGVQGSDLVSPCIPNGYDRVACWHMNRYKVTREQLAMIPVLMSHNAVKHPDAMCRVPYSLSEVLKARQIGKVTGLLECARRSDGGAAVIVATEAFIKETKNEKPLNECPVIISCGEGSGPLYPPKEEEITEDVFSCEKAAKYAYKKAQLGASDIDFWGLYDCFPICFLRALEAVNICGEGEAGNFVEDHYRAVLSRKESNPSSFPINTHGGLLCFGAPWEVPAMYNIQEAVEQLKGHAKERQVYPKPKRALVYGNGGIFSASAVAILGDGKY